MDKTDLKQIYEHCDFFVFDLDGTLLDTIDDLAGAANRALESEGFAPRSVEDIRRFVGSGVKVLLQRASGLKADEDLETVERLLKAFYKAYGEGLWIHTRPYPGIEDWVRELKARGKRVSVLTNKPEKFAVPLIEHFFPGLFELIWGQVEGRPRKPDPKAFFEQTALLGFDLKKTAYVGDSEVDMKTAVNAAVPAVGVTWGFRSEAELLGSGADVLIPSPEAAVNMLKEISFS